MHKAQGWSQEDLAARGGVPRQAVSRWKSNSAKPDADKIIAICDLFTIPADYLLRDQLENPSSDFKFDPIELKRIGQQKRKLVMGSGKTQSE